MQNSKEAVKHFKTELAFTAMPGTVKNAKNCVIIDVRRKEDHKKKHVVNAVNLPFNEYGGFTDKKFKKFPYLSKTKMNYVYCYNLYCNLSAKACLRFASLGYPVMEMKGGFDAWVSKKYATSRKK